MNHVHTPSDKEVQELERLHQDAKNADVRTRCDMILMSNKGLSPPKIAQDVCIGHNMSFRRAIEFATRTE